MRNFSKLAFLLILILLQSCENNVSKSLISKRIKNKCKNRFPCSIKLNELIDENWDTMFIFNINSDLAKINKILGFEYQYFYDVADRIIFVKNGKVVYHEEEYPTFDNRKSDEITFNFKKDSTYCYYIYSEKKFQVEKINSLDNNHFFMLIDE